MNSRDQLLNYWKQVPADMQKFLLRGLFLFIIWKAVYIFYIGPQGKWNEGLTELTGTQTASVLNVLRAEGQFTSQKQPVSFAGGEDRQFSSGFKSTLLYEGKTVLYIFDSCNGLELLVLYAGFILCYPGRWLRKALFITAGLPLIFYVNVIRCVALAFVSMLRPDFMDFAHHYLFKIMVYLCILLLWWLFTRYADSSTQHPASVA